MKFFGRHSHIAKPADEPPALLDKLESQLSESPDLVELISPRHCG